LTSGSPRDILIYTDLCNQGQASPSIDIPHDDAPPVECLRSIVRHHVLAMPQPDGMFG
jgi:hypothetical protein